MSFSNKKMCIPFARPTGPYQVVFIREDANREDANADREDEILWGIMFILIICFGSIFSSVILS